MSLVTSRRLAHHRFASRARVGALLATALLALFATRPERALAKTFTVDVSTDAKNPDGNDGDCTLREAIINASQNANNTPTTYADCPAGDPDPTVDVINFSVNNVTLAQDADEIFVASNLSSGPIEINGNVTIDGGGQARSKRIFRTIGDSDHTVKIVGLTFQNAWDGGGGAILNTGTSLIFQGVLFQDNKAISSGGGAINSAGGDAFFMDGVTFDQNEAQATDGGALYLSGSSTQVTLKNVTFSNNKAALSGGAAYFTGGGTTGYFWLLDNVQFNDNESLNGTGQGGNPSLGGGGALYNAVDYDETTIFKNCKFDGNKATQGKGGAIYNSIAAQNIEIQDSVFTLNFATNNDPVNITDQGFGGAVWNQGGLVLNRVTLDGNTAVLHGGGLGNKSSSGNNSTVANSTITGNIVSTSSSEGGGIWNDSSSTLVTRNTTVADNIALLGSGANLYNKGELVALNSIFANTLGSSNCAGPSKLTNSDGDGNVQWPGTSCDALPNPIASGDPKLGASIPAGGPAGSKVFPIGAGSAATSYGNATVCSDPPVSNLDQTNASRPQPGGTNCDSGAYESNRAAGYDSNPAPGQTIQIQTDTSTTGHGKVTVSETGTDDLHVTDVQITGDSEITLTSSQSFDIADGGQDVDITFDCASNQANTYNATLQVTHNGGQSPSSYTIQCDVQDNSQPGYGSTPSAGTTIILATTFGVDATQNVVISETGDATLSGTVSLIAAPVITSIELTSGDGPFAIPDGGASVTVGIKCSGTSDTQDAALLSVTHNANGSPALYPITCIIEGPNTPIYESLPLPGSTIDIVTAPNNAATTDIYVENLGNDDLDVSNIQLSGDSNLTLVSPSSFTLASKRPPKLVTVQCLSGSSGDYSTTVTATHNAPGSPATYTVNCHVTGNAIPGYGSSPASGSTIQFGTTLGSTGTASLTVSETGSAALNVSNVALSGDSEISFHSGSGSPFQIADGGLPVQQTLDCSSAFIGTYHATLTLTHDGSGSPAQYNVVCNVTATPSPVYSSSPGAGGGLALSTSTGNAKTGTIQVSNPGSSDLHVTNVSLSGDPEITLTSSSSFTQTANAAPTNVDVQCSSAIAGPYSSTLTITHDAPGSPATYTIDCNVTQGPTPGYGSNPVPGSSLPITASTGTPATTDVIVSETGNAPLDVTNVAVTGDPELSLTTASSFQIADGGLDQTVTVQCSSNQAGQYTGTLTVTHNAAGSPATYPITCDVSAPAPGYGSNPTPGSTLTLGTTAGTPTTTNVVVSETGDAPLDVSSVAVTGDAPLTLTTASSFQIADGGLDQTITVQCSSAQVGQYTGTLTVTHNASGSPATYPIQCNVSAVPTPGYGSSPAPGTTLPLATTANTPTSTSVTVSETGSATLNVTNVAVTGDPEITLTTASSFQISDGGISQDITVQCSASQIGQYTATLTVTHNAAGSPASYPITCDVSAAPAPGYGSNPNPGATLTLSTSAGVATATNVVVSETGTATLSVSNVAVTGDAPLTLTSSSSFQIVDGGPSQNITVQCSSAQAGQFTGTLTVTHNATGSPATYPIQCDVAAQPTPGYGSSPGAGTTLTIGTTPNVAGSATVTVSETGSATLSVSSVAVSGSAALSRTSAASFQIVNGGPSQSVTVQCLSSQTGQFNGTLTVTHNANGSPATYPIQCNVTAVPTPGYASSPNPGSTIPLITSPLVTAGGQVTVSEAGSANLTVSNVAMSGDPEIILTSAASFTIPDGTAPQDITFQCTSAVEGSFSATLTVTHNAAGSPASYTISCNVSSVQQAVGGDFDADGNADMMWQNVATGDVLVWFMNGSQRLSQHSLNPGQVPVGWKVAGSADFNQDGRADLLLRNGTTGALRIWYMKGYLKTGEANVTPASVADAGLEVVGVGDFNGDGKPDVLRQQPGQMPLNVVFLNGAVATKQAYLNPEKAKATKTQSVGCPDLNGDGKPDILFTLEGQLSVWFMDGIKRIGTANLVPANPTTTKYRVVGTADYNGDGKADLLFQSKKDGKLELWFMNGINRISSVVPSPSKEVSTDWVVVAPR